MRYYYKDTNNNYYNFDHPEFEIYEEQEVGQEEIEYENGEKEICKIIAPVKVGLQEGFTEITEEEFNEHKELLNRYKTDELQEELSQCYERLRELDYIGIKIATGRATREEYSDEIAEMDRLAQRINEIKSLEKKEN